MYIILILFFLSLAGIIIMITKKLILLENGQLVPQEDFSVEIPKLQEVKFIAIKHIRKHSYFVLVATIRFYIKSSDILKRLYERSKIKTKELTRKYILRKEKKEIEQKKEVSGFLKMISEYKNKIRKIKHKIKEEEKLN